MSTLPDITRNFHGGNQNSEAANASVYPHKVLDRQRIITALYHDGAKTCDELEVLLEMPHQSCSARITELADKGVIFAISRRPTRSGRNASVYSLGTVGRERFEKLNGGR